MKFKNYVNKHTGDNRIYSLNDITQMALGDVLKNKEELLSQYRELGVPTESELQSSENVVYVHAYTRDDGTEVKAHYRSKPDGIMTNNLTTENKIQEDGTLTGGASEKSTEYTDYTIGEPIVDVSTPEKVQKLMYPEEIAGVKRGEPKTLLQVAQIGVNPNFNPESEEEDYSINCSSAVFAADIQSRGYDVQAVPGSDAKVKELSADISCGYLNPKTGELCSPEVIYVDEGESCYNYIQEKFPNDSRGILRYKIKLDAKDYASQDGHRVLVGKGKNGDIIFFDPQDNEYHEGADAKKYMDSWINKNTIDQDSYTFILRIDDKIPDPYYIHEVVRKR